MTKERVYEAALRKIAEGDPMQRAYAARDIAVAALRDAVEPSGYAKCVHSMADAVGVAEERWSIDGWCAACAWHASQVNRSEKPE